MTIAEIESACDASLPLEFPRHELEVPELSHCEMFFPLGFPTELRTNSPEILSQARNLWPIPEKRFNTEPIRVDVHVMESGSTECPPAPVFRFMYPLMISVADTNNYRIGHLDRNLTQVTISRATERHSSYLGYFFLGFAPHDHIESRFAAPVHAGCVVRNGRGVLLCGDSGAGKSSLSYACARSGWTYVSDDGSDLLIEGSDRLVIGNCHQVRFRPSAAQLFPELEGLEGYTARSGKTIDRVANCADRRDNLRAHGAGGFSGVPQPARSRPSGIGSLSQRRGAVFYAPGIVRDPGEPCRAIHRIGAIVDGEGL